MKRLSKLQIIIYDAGAVIMIISLFLLHTSLAKYIPFVYGAGAAMFLVMQFKSQEEGANVVIRRLQRQQVLGAVILFITSMAMWMEVNQHWPLRHNEWVLFLAIGTWMQLYTAFRLPKEIEKEKNDNRQ